MNYFKTAMATALLVVTWSVGAVDLNEVKSSGQVGERADGYLGYVSIPVATDVTALVDEVNDKRRTEYARIAKKNDITREKVEMLAGRKSLSKTVAGNYIFANGEWQKK